MPPITVIRHEACDRARSLVSLRLDDQLSQLEEALLESHLDDCRECFVFAADLLAFTSFLRTAPPVALERPMPVPVPYRPSYLRGLQNAAAGAVAAAAVFAGVVGITPTAVQREERPELTSVAEPVSPETELRLAERAKEREVPGAHDIPL